MTRISRRQWLATVAGMGLAGTGLGAYAAGEADDVILTRHDVPLAGLPEAFEGLRVAQVTDVHLPANREAARRAVALLARERPEIVLHTGDIIEDLHAADVVRDFAAAARGTLATFATMGNWEWSCGCEPGTAREIFASAGVRFLYNEHAVVEHAGARLAIVGLDDPSRGTPRVELAEEGLDLADARLVAMHAPGLAAGLARRGRGDALFLSGHTHGGQIRVPFLPAMLPRGSGGFVAGAYGVPAGRLYVSRGVGTSGIRARLRCPAELPVFTLRRA